MIKTILNKYPIITFSVFFLLLRLPYFIWNSFPRIDGDTFEYFEYAYDIKNGILPDFSVIPPLYSVFLFLLSSLGISLYGFVVFKVLLAFLGYAFLFTQLKKTNVLPVWSLLLFIIIVSSSSFNLQLETAFMTESLYKPILLFFIGLIIRLYNNPTLKSNYILIPLFAVVAALVRSNGMYLYFFVVLIIGFLFFFKRKKYWKQFILITSTFVILNGAWSIFNYASYGTPLFGNTYRIKVILGNIINNTRHNHNGNIRAFWQDSPGDGIVIYPYLKKLNFIQEVQAKNIKNKPELLLNYLYSSAESDIKFYNDIITERHQHSFSKDQLVPGPNELKYVKRCYQDVNCRDYALKEFGEGGNSIIKSGIWGKSIDFINSTFQILTGNLIVIFLFVSLSILVLIRVVLKLKQLSKETMLLSMVSLAYLLNVVVVTMTHNRFVARYEQVCSFMVVLFLFLFIGFYIKKRSLKLN